jgi:L-lactate dehydrogenase
MKIGMVGSGLVGSTAAYAMVMQGIGRELILVDIDQERSRAEASDILHAVPFAHPLKVRSGGYTDLKGSEVVVVTAGANQEPGESRLDLLERNAEIFEGIIPKIVQNTPEAILIVVTNPVDIMTHLTANIASNYDIPSNRILGSGTMLDTARFRALVGECVGVDALHVHAYVIGEHGDSEVLTWSLVRIGAVPLDTFCELRDLEIDEEVCADIDQRVRAAAYEIIEGKGATYYGIGSALAQLTEVILHNQRRILTVCTPEGNVAGLSNVTLSLPRLIGGDGVITTFPIPMNDAEKKAFKESAHVINDSIESLQKPG